MPIKEIFKIVWCTVWSLVVFYRLGEILSDCTREIEKNKANGKDNGYVGCAIVFFVLCALVVLGAFWYLTL